MVSARLLDITGLVREDVRWIVSTWSMSAGWPSSGTKKLKYYPQFIPHTGHFRKLLGYEVSYPHARHTYPAMRSDKVTFQ